MRNIFFVSIFLFSTLLTSHAQLPPNFQQWLQQNAYQLAYRINQYAPDRYNLLVGQQKTSIKQAVHSSRVQQSNWQVATVVKEVSNNTFDIAITFHCVAGSLKNASVSVDVDVLKWSASNYVLLPSSAYNGNKYAYRRLRYSPKLYEVQDIGVDKPIILTDIPKLSEANGVSRIQERSGSLATPAMGYRDSARNTGFWLLTHQGNRLGDYGMDVEETRNRNKAIFSITAPIVREQYVYKICDNRVPSWDEPKDFKQGDKVTIQLRVQTFAAPTTQEVFNQFARIRKTFITDTALTNQIPYAAAMQLLEKKYNEKNFVPEHGYYAIGLRENFLQDWQIGWTGGMITTYPLLFAGNDTTVNRVLRNFDWLFAKGISPSGFYWDAGRNGTEWFGGDIRKPHTKNWHLVRKSADAVWYIIKQFKLMEQKRLTVKPQWKAGNARVCDAFVKVWNKYHQLGQFVDSQTGDITVGGSSSGALVPAALLAAADYYKNDTYKQTAIAIGNYLNVQFVQKGIACGGPGDALQNFDSESAYYLVESFVALYEATNDAQWLTIAENAAKQFSTWVVSYNYRFPDTSAFGKAKIHSIGTVYANTQNKHAAPGMCTASGLGLLKLYQYTGNSWYVHLLQDIAHGITQYLPHPQKPLGNAPFGYVSERINLSDWEGPETIGYILPLTTWAETSLMLTTIEIPGVYIQVPQKKVIAFDNIDAKWVEEKAGKVTVLLTNNSLVDASVSIWVNSGKNKLLADNYLYQAERITLKKGESKKYTIDSVNK